MSLLVLQFSRLMVRCECFLKNKGFVKSNLQIQDDFSLLILGVVGQQRLLLEQGRLESEVTKITQGSF